MAAPSVVGSGQAPPEPLTPVPDIAAVVVHYGTPEALASCLHALQGETGMAEIVIVDNSAREAPLPAPTSSIPCQLLRSSENLGFGRACNLGARSTASQFLLLMNADVTVRGGAVTALANTLARSERRGLVGPRVWDALGEIELSARAFPTWKTGIVGRTSAITRLLARRGRPPGELAAARGPAQRVDWVSGACQLVRRSAFEAVGGFDESYWMYWEDADLCWRLRDLGFETWFEPAGEVEHLTGSSGRNPRTIRAFHDSAARFYEQHVAHGHWDGRAVRRVLEARAEFQIARLSP